MKFLLLCLIHLLAVLYLLVALTDLKLFLPYVVALVVDSFALYLFTSRPLLTVLVVSRKGYTLGLFLGSLDIIDILFSLLGDLITVLKVKCRFVHIPCSAVHVT